MATISDDKTVKIWNISIISKWVLVRKYEGHTGGVYGLEYINADTIASGSLDCTIQIWSIRTGLTIRTINVGLNLNVLTLQLLSNSFYLATGVTSGLIIVYDINDGSVKSTLSGHESQTMDFVLIGSDFLASSSCDKTIRLWNLTTNTPKFTLSGHTSDVYKLKLVSSDLLASASLDNSIIIWNVNYGTRICVLVGHSNYILWSIDAFNSNILVSGSYDKFLKIWNWTNGEILASAHTGLTIRSLAILKKTTRKIFINFSWKSF